MIPCTEMVRLIAAGGLAVALFVTQRTYAADRPQWGEFHTRNMESSETGLPVDFDPVSGKNVKWSIDLGTNGYGSPVIAGGKVLIGANNEKPRDARIKGDRGVMLCVNEADGAFCWQLAVPRIGGDDYKDWPLISMCSPPSVEGHHAYFLTNRFEVVCVDLDGQKNGNDGPYKDEGRHMIPESEAPLDVSACDADIIWLTDLKAAVGMYPHDGAHASVLIDGPYLYLNTGNGVDMTHKVVRKPDAPCLVVLEKATGKVVAQDGEHIGPRIFHATWSSPAMGTVNGKKLLAFGGPDGVCYGLEPVKTTTATVQTLKRVWRFDGDPSGPKENVAQYLENRKVSPSTIESLPVFIGNRVYITVGGDIWWGKEKAWLKCIDATKTGEITRTAEIWSYTIDSHCVSTPAVANGLIFVGDCKGVVHCVDAKTGQACWTHELGGDIWGSALVADGKVYIGSRNKSLGIFAATREKTVLATIKFPAPISSTPVAANGVLYVNTMEKLYALKDAGASK